MRVFFPALFLVVVTPIVAAAGAISLVGRNQGDLAVPEVGETNLRILAPTWLELRLITTKAPDPARVARWDFVDDEGELNLPVPSSFVVTADGEPVSVIVVGFRRRPIWAPLDQRDLRIANALFLELATSIPDGATVEVTNPAADLWPPTEHHRATADPLRLSPVLHVNQEGYVPTLPKKAMVGYYLGSLGELPMAGLSAFNIVDAVNGTTVFHGTLRVRRDVGYTYTPLPYQQVLEADFSDLTTPGEYALVVPGLGASPVFLLDDGIAMGWLRTYALGLYHQRCGTTNAMPFTRFIHDACHLAHAEVPASHADFTFTWKTIASRNSDYAKNPRHTAAQLTDPASSLYPFVNRGPVDTAGGHHDAGDYSKYTINSAALVHFLMFTVDVVPGAGALDNLGLPESGDGIGDLLQEAKWEADYLAKLQDADGGFYFIVYPKTRAYEHDVSLANGHDGDTQVVWPKNTAATAAAVAALAQCASSPAFRRHYPTAAADYLERARRGWEFLTTAFARYGRDGAYQKITHYGDQWMHDDEVAWAACELYLATGDSRYQQDLFEWFPDVSDPKTFRWGWWRAAESWGNAIRSYAFAARTGRLPAEKLDPVYLRRCEEQLLAAADDARRWSEQNAYGTSFPSETKRFRAAGWYFSLDHASDLAAAWLIKPEPQYLEALVANLNYEGGTNPVNVSFVTGLGVRRPHVVVSQYAHNARQVLPPDGLPIGNIQAGFGYLQIYGRELGRLSFPSDGATTAPYPFYDRWADTWNVSTEFITVNLARSLLAVSVLVAPTPAARVPWTSGTAVIVGPTTVVPLGVPVTFSVETPGLDPLHTRIVWEGRDQQPAFGSTFAFAPKNPGPQWVEVEVMWPDGRRVVATSTFIASEGKNVP